MGKQLLSINSTVQFQNKHGCMWGIFHMLDYHRWRNVKKVFPHKRHYLGRHATYYKKRGSLSNHSDSEDRQFENVDVEPLPVRQRNKKVRAAGKIFTGKGKRGLHIENRSKEESSKDGILSLQNRPQDFESSDEFSVETSKLDRDVFSKFKEHADVVEVFRAEKDFLLKFLRDLDVGARSFRNKKARLTKSGTFPIAASSQMQNFKSRSTLKHKQTEIWAFPKGEKSLAGAPASEMFTNDGAYMKEVPLAGDYGMDSAMKQTGWNHKHKGWNQLVIHRFKVIKQRIMHALMEFTKNGYHTSSEAFRRRVSYENQLGKEVSQSLEDGVTENIISNEIKASDYGSNKHEIPLMRRTSSLNESMDRYTQLFERTFAKDVKWHSSMSKSLKVTNADNNRTSGHAPKSSKRNLSLPNIESIGFILHEAICDAHDAGSIPARRSLDKNKTEETDILVQRKSVSLLVSKDKPRDDIIGTEAKEEDESSGRDVTPNPLSHSTAENGSSYQENAEIEMTLGHGKDMMNILEASCEDISTDNTRGTERNIEGSSVNDMEADLLKIESRNSLQAKGTNRSSDNSFLLLESNIIDDSNFKYVKYIMELSGFMENDHTQMWHTVNQPLKPSLFEETECSEKEIDKPTDHRLLFDIVNESLLEVFEGSSTYFPRPFSFNLRLRPIPKGHRLLKEVWTKVNSYLSLTPELDQTLDDVVRRDLESNGWMNLQSEEECVALELEDMIVDDLLDEIIFS
ncbi:hypothetical protein QN277_001948 [Acacia crassicarpa]|uniref:DUF4378 domain-containing protein n=1 Tax=Acacia crassicarpa TaxID=499986 RepID=A0AAE1N9J9_9FABA|nr:hypothetical protein QN277_001948 [Acacia crassicarpa]